VAEHNLGYTGSSYKRDSALARAAGTLASVTLSQIFPVEGTRKKIYSYFAKDEAKA